MGRGERRPPRIPGWRRFLRREDFSRHIYSSFVPSRPTVDIMHGDLECRYTFPQLDGRTPAFLNYPWYRANGETRPAPYQVLTTDLREGDIVLGGLKKARACLAAAAREADAQTPILLNSACVPDLTGENLSALLKSHAGKTPLFYHPSAGKDIAPIIIGDLIALSGGRPKRRRRAAARSINLIGHPGGRALDELTDLLKECGVRVEARLLPGLAPAALRRARRASAQLVVPNRFLQTVSREVLKAFDLPVVEAPAPYGVEATERWLAAAAQTAGGRAWKRAWRSRRARHDKPWRRLIRLARRFRLGLIVDPTELAALSDPASNGGIPLVPVLKEMGFGIDLLVYSAAKTRRRPAPAGKGRHRLHIFRSPAELHGLLRRLPCRAFYSDCFFDSRISRSGKGQFSLADFEPGLAGARRTLERLLGVCRLPFYERYARYIGAARGKR